MLQEDTEGFTQLVENQNQPVQNHGLFAEFYLKPVQDNAKTLEEGRPIFSDQPYIKIMVPGDKSSVIQRPVRLGRSPEHDNVKFGPQYQAFLQGQDQAQEGTPLREWPLMSQSQVKELEHFNVKTVEMLAQMPDTHAGKFMGIAKLKQQAIAYIEAAKGNAPLAKMQSELQERDNQIETLQTQMAEMAEEMKSLQKPKRGRPPQS